MSGDMQFGFQKCSGTELCTWTLLESVEYYLNRGSIAYVTFMDCTKAFDKVEHSKLFEKIIRAKVHLLYSRLLLHTYRNQSMAVIWDGVLSKGFPIRNGVRQGAVLLPILFDIYNN